MPPDIKSEVRHCELRWDQLEASHVWPESYTQYSPDDSTHLTVFDISAGSLCIARHRLRTNYHFVFLQGGCLEETS